MSKATRPIAPGTLVMFNKRGKIVRWRRPGVILGIAVVHDPGTHYTVWLDIPQTKEMTDEWKKNIALTLTWREETP